MKTKTLTFISLIALFLLCGCTSNPRYVEGTMTQIGAYVPYDGGMFGCEVLQYLSGCSIRIDTNQTMTIDRTYSSTNSYLGIIHTTENTTTKVKVEK